MKTYKLTICAIIIGTITIILSAYRYYFTWYDMSQFSIFCFMGVVVIAFGYVYNQLRYREERHKELERVLESIETRYNTILTFKNKMEEELNGNNITRTNN